MNYLSLFTGIGGFDLGFDRAGMKCIGQVENNPHCQNVLRYHYPNVERYGDIQNVEPERFKSVDVICGGFPCQDLSVAGKRKGLAGSRSGLFFEFARIVSFVKPKLFVLENVPGLLSSGEGRDFAIILRWLEKCGYLQAWRVLDSQYFGVAQRRRRVFIVGSLGNGSCAEILFESESLSRNPAEGRKAGEGTATDVVPSLNASGRGVSRAGESRGQDPVIAVPNIAMALTRRDCKDADSDTKEGHLIVAYENHPADSRVQEVGDTMTALTERMGTGGGNVPLVQNICFQQNTRDEVREIGGKIAGCISAEPGAKQQNYVAYPLLTPERDEQRQQGPPHRENNEPMFTLNAQDQHGVATNMAVRRLTPRECERLQGFPNDWTRYGIDENGNKVEISDTQRYKMCGNAVTRQVPEWIGKRIIKVKI